MHKRSTARTCTHPTDWTDRALFELLQREQLHLLSHLPHRRDARIYDCLTASSASFSLYGRIEAVHLPGCCPALPAWQAKSDQQQCTVCLRSLTTVHCPYSTASPTAATQALLMPDTHSVPTILLSDISNVSRLEQCISCCCTTRIAAVPHYCHTHPAA
jgi:hypothetical protein